MDAARKFVDKGQIDKAVKEYLRIVSEDPKDVRVWLKIGDLYAKKGLASQYWHAAQLGTPHILDREELAEVRNRFSQYGQQRSKPRRSW